MNDPVEQDTSLMEFQSGDATLAALIAAYQLGIKPIGAQVESHSEANPDPESFKARGKRGSFDGQGEINKAFVKLVQGVNPDFDPSKQMNEVKIDPLSKLPWCYVSS